jgi:hypothetical protein
MACSSTTPIGCIDRFGCLPSRCPDFTIRQHDTKPDFRFDVEDCDGPMDLTDLVCEASMWVKAKLKKAITAADTYFGLADAIGFDQIQVGDIIVMDRARAPEQMLVTGFDEVNRLVQVQRGYNGSVVSAYPRGAGLKAFRTLNAVATTEMVREDIPQVDGTVQTAVLTKSTLVYEWAAEDTCLAGCYWFEFKLLKMQTLQLMASAAPSVSFISYSPSDTGCALAAGVEWVRRFPTTGDGFLIQIGPSPTAENVIG